MTSLDVSTIQARLGASPRFSAWLENLDSPKLKHQLNLPDDAEAERLLVLFGVDSLDRTACLAARPDPDLHPEMWWVASRIYQDLISKMGCNPSVDQYSGWPELPETAGPIGRHLYVWIYLAALPHSRRFHQERNVQDDVSWTSLSYLGEELRQRRLVYGVSGLTYAWSLPLLFRGASFRLGRHAFDRGTGGLNVHVPEGGRLDPDVSQASFDWARRFFPSVFPKESIHEFTCHSWLLDDALAEYLPATSNIIRFQKRFKLQPENPDDNPASGDNDILELVFHRPPVDAKTLDTLLDDLPQETSLQQAYVKHLRSGKHWRARTGTFPF